MTKNSNFVKCDETQLSSFIEDSLTILDDSRCDQAEIEDIFVLIDNKRHDIKIKVQESGYLKYDVIFNDIYQKSVTVRYREKICRENFPFGDMGHMERFEGEYLDPSIPPRSHVLSETIVEMIYNFF